MPGLVENWPPEHRRTSRKSTPDENSMSSPTLPAFADQVNSKPKKRPTVTPRTFTRFFTPRSSGGRGKRISAARQALRDITGTASNRKASNQPGTAAKNGVKVCEDTVIGFADVSGSRKRRIPRSPDTSPNRSSPHKRNRGGSGNNSEHDDQEDKTDHEQELPGSLDDTKDTTSSTKFQLTRPLVRGTMAGPVGRVLRRELDISCSFRGTRAISYCNTNWQTETTDFFTQAEDSYLCNNVDTNSEERALPFCTASCNTNTLVAIGDQEGGVRLLESAKDGKPGFSQPYLSFHPHANAILDLAFSADDLLLATASADQMAQIIDMPTQRAVTTLEAHVSSVKQVRFQPGSSSVLATSSRDGSVRIWDLRCKGFSFPSREIWVSLEPSDSTTNSKNSKGKGMNWAHPTNSYYDAHAIRSMDPATFAPYGFAPYGDAPSKTETPGRRGDVSITALSFLPAGREHLFVTGSEANASVKLWDLRATDSYRRGRATPLSTTAQPESHNKHRQFGLTSLTLSGDGGRLYTLCRDNTVYAYSTAHLILGHAPELSSRPSRPARSGAAEKSGLGPLYGFRHPQFHVTTFYVKLALRAAAGNKSELLAVGSSEGCAVLFPTDEQYLNRKSPSLCELPCQERMTTPAPTPCGTRPPLSRNGSGTGPSTRHDDTMPIYEHGSALVRGHSVEVTGLTWTLEGELVTVGDDFVARCWREAPKARDLRTGGERGGRRWGCGWAEAEDEWDDDE